MAFADWAREVPDAITGDALWKVEAYRLALFAADLCWHDASRLMRDTRTREIIGQLYRAMGSVSANIAEGYSRGSAKDRARFYEYALGSARETRDWYFKARHVLGAEVIDHRLDLVTQIIRLLLTMVPQQRSYTMHEPEEPYGETGE